MQDNPISTAYSRGNPSPRYRNLVEMYRVMHEHGEAARGVPADQTFAGGPRENQIARTRQLIQRFGARTLLDYGAGKGAQYGPLVINTGEGEVFHSLAEFLGLDAVTCYDPGYAPFSSVPEGTFDGVVCIDVLEHCPEEDVPWIVDELFGFARKFVFANIACFPAVKTLPNGENAHCTIQPRDWWKAMIDDVSARHPDVRYFFIIETKNEDGQKEESLLEG